MWKIDGEAIGDDDDDDDDSEYDELDDENDDSDNRIYFSENIAMMETHFYRALIDAIFLSFSFSVFFLLRRHKGSNFEQKV